MSETDVFTGERYEIIAFANGQTPIYYEELEAKNCKDGVWLLITTDFSNVYVYIGDSSYRWWPPVRRIWAECDVAGRPRGPATWCGHGSRRTSD